MVPPRSPCWSSHPWRSPNRSKMLPTGWGRSLERSVPKLTKNLESTGADSRTEERILHRGIHPCSLRQRREDIARQRRDDGQNKNGDDGHVLPVVFNLTGSLGTLSVAAHSGVKVLPLPESVNSMRTMKHVPAQRQSRKPPRITVSADIERVKSEALSGGIDASNPPK